MALRLAFDLDGVLADFDSGYRLVEERLFGVAVDEVPGPEAQAEAEEDEDETGLLSGPERRARSASGRERVWREIQATPDFWTTLKPLDPTAIPRIRALSVLHRWEVVFITQRPHTAGETVQCQTQRWLIQQGFELPSVLVLRGSRGKVADALHLDFVIDDSPQNCVDILAESRTRAILVLPGSHDGDQKTERARQLGIGVVASVAAALDFLESVEVSRANPSLLEKIARKVGLGGMFGVPEHKT
jgi:hypothetical protein